LSEQQQEPITQDELRRRVILHMRQVDEVDLLMIFNHMKMRTGREWKYMQCCVGLHKENFPIYPKLVAWILNVSYAAALVALHRLGDVGALTLRREVFVNKSGVYALNPRFINVFNQRMVHRFKLDKVSKNIGAEVTSDSKNNTTD
jgi:hypothetical protein